jgi:short subunit dehydrogenase-like uncharacterized protein
MQLFANLAVRGVKSRGNPIKKNKWSVKGRQTNASLRSPRRVRFNATRTAGCMHKSRITEEKKLTAVSLVGDQHHFLHTARVTPQFALGAVTPAVAAAHHRRHLNTKPTKHHTNAER